MKLSRVTSSGFAGALRKLMSEPVSLKVAFKLKGVAARVESELKKYEEVRQAALEKYGSKDADGKLVVNPDGSVPLSAENMEKFRGEIEELFALDVEIAGIPLSELDGIKLSAQDVMELDGILVEE